MNFAQLKTIVETRLSRSNTEVTDQIGTWLNGRIRTICDEKNFWFLKVSRSSNLVATKQDYYYPADASTIYKDDAILYLRNTTDDKHTILPMISLEEALKLYKPEEDGEPEHWIANDASFRIVPIPDNTYDIVFSYYQFFADLVKDSDTNVLTNEMSKLLIEGTLADGFDYLQEPVDMAIHEQKFEKLLKSLVIRDLDRKLPEEIMVIPSVDVNATRY